MESEIPKQVRSGASDYSISMAIDANVAGIRLDQFLALKIPSLSRSVLADSIRKGHILVNEVSRRSSYRLKEGEVVVGAVEGRKEIDIHPQAIDFSIIFEDDFLLVLSKPPGLVVHPGSGNMDGTLVNGLVHYCQSLSNVGDSRRPGIVHRLDKDTSGIMLVAKQDDVHRRLVDDFKNRRLTKEYLALLHGHLKVKSGRIVAPISRHPVHRQKMAVNMSSGRHAASSWQVVKEYSNPSSSLVKVIIETGRTHQIRVHMAHLGCPVAGDRVYGGHHDNSSFPRQLLHALKLAFHHPITGQFMEYTASPWPDFAQIMNELDAMS